MVKLGYNVTLFDIDNFIIKKGKKPFSKEAKEILSNEIVNYFIKLHNKEKYDIFFSYLHSGQIEPIVFKEIKKHIKTINYTTNFHQFPMYSEIANYVDLNIYISKIAKNGFDKIGAASYYMPLAANPEFYKRSENKTEDIVFIGSSYGNRPYYFWRVLQNGIKINLYGPGWERNESLRLRIRDLIQTSKYLLSGNNEKLRILFERQRTNVLLEINKKYSNSIFPSLTDNEFANKLSNSAIVINFNESRYNNDYLNHNVLFGCNLRDFESTMSGTFSLTQYSEELYDFFEEGKEVVSFKNEFELVDKLKYYKAHPIEREKIAYNGYLRAIKDHTWQNRFDKFFNYFNF
jgi:spore maturation protein CgeB